MISSIAEWLNNRGMAVEDSRPKRAITFYKCAALLAPRWSVPRYNAGLREKYQGNWKASLKFNQQAVVLDPDDEAGWWNLGIAATALRDWQEAARAWTTLNIEVSEKEDGELRMPQASGCVRLNPDKEGEVVWGIRLDPARTVLLSVPLPQSQHRFHDIILNDGAAEGTRMRGDAEVPVLNELEVWKRSQYSTFEVTLTLSSEEAQAALVDLCDRAELGIEDWSSVRFICAECSKGNATPHECKPIRHLNTSTYGFGAKNEDRLRKTLREWAESTEDTAFGDIELVLKAD